MKMFFFNWKAALLHFNRIINGFKLKRRYLSILKILKEVNVYYKTREGVSVI